MEITRENIDDLNGLIKVTIKPEDYQHKVKSTLEKYRKTAKIPGFRPGHVPISLIQKQYGKSVLAEELNKLTNDGIYNYISENNLDILGNPIPSKNNDVKGDFNNPKDFEFSFDLGFAPKFDLPINEKTKFNYNLVNVDKELLNKQVSDLRRRYGKLSTVDVSEENDMLVGAFNELKNDGTLKENGVSNSSTISLEFLSDKNIRKELSGRKIGEIINLDIDKVSKGDKDKAALLGIKEEELEGVGNNFQFTVNEIKRMELSELNTDFFDKLFANGEVKTENEFYEKIEEDLKNMFAKESDRLLTKNAYDYLLDKTKLSFPEDFLKRWIKLSNDQPLTDEQIDAEFQGYLKSLKWQLIQNKIFVENNISIGNEEILNYTKSLLIGNYSQYGMPAPDDKELTETAQKLLKNKEQANGVYNQLTEIKLTDYFKQNLNLTEKKLSYDEFVEATK